MTLDVERLSVRIGHHTLVHEVSFQAQPGQCLALLGRNGAGKTSLVRGLAGLLPAAGAATLEGERLDLLSAAERARRIGYVAQGLGPSALQLTTFELILLALNGGNLGWRVPPGHLERAGEVLAMLGLEPLARRLPAQMSGGQRQMVALAAALAPRPRLLLLDEPTSALDLANQLALLDLVRAYTAKEGIVTLMVLHDLNMVGRYADRVLMLEKGQLRHAGPAQEALTVARIAEIFGVDCCVLPADGGQRAIYPLAARRA